MGKLKFAFMMYDEEQESAASKAEILELLKAMAPHIHERERLKHASRMYSMHNLHSNMRITIDEFIEYIMKDEYAKELVPASVHSSSDGTSSVDDGGGEKDSLGSSSWGHTPSSSAPETRSTTMEPGSRRATMQSPSSRQQSKRAESKEGRRGSAKRTETREGRS